MTADQALLLDNVSISYGGRVLVALTHRVAPGEVLTVMGPSGSGKSTLLAYIGGFLDRVFEASGTVRVGAVDLTALPAEDRHAGILFQDLNPVTGVPYVGSLWEDLPYFIGRLVCERWDITPEQ